MKRVLSILLVIVLGVSLMTGCSTRPESEPQAAPGAYTGEKVPDLNLVPVDPDAPFESATAQTSNYSWSWPKEDGEMESVEACGMAPTDPLIREHLSALAMREAITVKLVWPSYQARSVEVTSWDVGVFGLSSEADISQQNEYLRDAELNSTEDYEYTLTLEPNRVYDICASWPEAEGSSFGNAHYYLITESETEETEQPESVITGGWTATASPEMTEDIQTVFDKAAKKEKGVKFTPIAYLGTQVVAGQNHAILCKAELTSKNAIPYYALVYIYESLDGDAEIIEIVGMTAYGELITGEALSPQLVGSWNMPEANTDGFAAVEKAMQLVDGATYTPIYVLGNQVVAGMNYCVLCQSTGVYSDAEPYYTLVFVYEDLNGNAQFTSFVDLDASGRPKALTGTEAPTQEINPSDFGAPDEITIDGETYAFSKLDEVQDADCGMMDGTSEEGYNWQYRTEEGTVSVYLNDVWLIYTKS